MRIFKLIAAAGILSTLLATSASAYDWSAEGVHVISVEPSYLPDMVVFKIDRQVGSCPAGAILNWNIKGTDATSRSTNAMGVYSGLLTALASGRTINVYGSNTNCTVDFIHLT